MECLGPECANLLIEWLQQRSVQTPSSPIGQGSLFKCSPYVEEAPAIRTRAELAGALEHLEYAIFRRYENQLTRAERARLDNSIDNALFKVDRYVRALQDDDRDDIHNRCLALRESVVTGRERVERMRHQAKRADLKLAQLSTLTPEGFEEFVAEVFEAMGYEVECVGGSGDEGVDLKVTKAGLIGIVQCKYFAKGVIGSPELQKFLGTIHHTRSHKGFFVTTRTFTLAPEKFVATHPIELIDGPRLVELVQEAMGPITKRETEQVWF
jgi:restriction system protein